MLGGASGNWGAVGPVRGADSLVELAVQGGARKGMPRPGQLLLVPVARLLPPVPAPASSPARRLAGVTAGGPRQVAAAEVQVVEVAIVQAAQLAQGEVVADLLADPGARSLRQGASSPPPPLVPAKVATRAAGLISSTFMVVSILLPPRHRRGGRPTDGHRSVRHIARFRIAAFYSGTRERAVLPRISPSVVYLLIKGELFVGLQ